DQDVERHARADAHGAGEQEVVGRRRGHRHGAAPGQGGGGGGGDGLIAGGPEGDAAGEGVHAVVRRPEGVVAGQDRVAVGAGEAGGAPVAQGRRSEAVPGGQSERQGRAGDGGGGQAGEGEGAGAGLVGADVDAAVAQHAALVGHAQLGRVPGV